MKCSLSAGVATDLVFQAPSIAEDINKGKHNRAALRTFVTAHQSVMVAAAMAAGGPAGVIAGAALSIFYAPFHKAIDRIRN